MVQPIGYGNCYIINIPSPLVSFYSGHIMRLGGMESTVDGLWVTGNCSAEMKCIQQESTLAS
jgi:hypothetical protein